MSSHHTPSSKTSAIALLGRSSYIGSQFLFILLITHILSVEEVGSYGLALAITGPIFALAQFDIRLLLSTETSHPESFRTHITLLFLNTFIAIFLSTTISFFFIRGASENIVVITLLISLSKTVESLTLLSYGIAQRKNNFVHIALSELIRGPLTVIIAGITLKISTSLPLALCAYVACWSLIFFLYDRKWMLRSCEVLDQPQVSASLWQLYMIASPLGIRTVVISMLTNIPRYCIFYSHGERMLGYYTPLSYLLAAFAFFTTLLRDLLAPHFTEVHHSKSKSIFRVGIKMLPMLILALFSLNVLFALWGSSILTLLFGNDYSAFNHEFSILVFGYSAMAVYSILDLVMSIYRETLKILLTCLVAVGINILCSFALIAPLGIKGAAVSYAISAWTLLLLSGFFLYRLERKSLSEEAA